MQHKPRPHMAKDEQRYFGHNACHALWQERPEDIIRVYIHKDLEPDSGALIDWCKKSRKAFHIVDEKDLEKLTDTVHHQGICIVAKSKRDMSLEEFLQQTRRSQPHALLYLDGVANPHNLGAIIRTAAHFGVRYIMLEKQSLPRLSPAANRTSEGGAEFVELVRVDNGLEALTILKEQKYTLYSADLHEKAYSLYETKFTAKNVFIFGAEVHGISEAINELADFIVKIPGTDAVESLNVSVSAALFLGEAYRQAGQGTRRIVAPKS